MFGVMNSLDVVICEDADDAIAKGYDYGPDFNRIEIQKVVVVKNGTAAGKSTADLIIVDENGNKSVVMLTGALLKAIPC